MSDEKSTAEMFYGKPQEKDMAVNAALELKPSDVFYRAGAGADSSPYAAALRPGIEKLGLPPDEAKALLHDIGIRAHDMEMSAVEVGNLNNLVVKHIVDQPDAATVEKWGQEARAAIREKYGVAAGDKLLQETQQFIANDAKLRAYFERSGVGSRVEAVTLMVEKVQNLRAKGRLK